MLRLLARRFLTPGLVAQRLGLGLETLGFAPLLFALSFMPRRIVLDGEGGRLRG
ncbi:MAG TPA: hypothetical protein VJT77_11150 [Burkholderiales bacterium]|nr:hypothetical protein [Burkholderiales bacterium]